jgi:hypothetical protein
MKKLLIFFSVPLFLLACKKDQTASGINSYLKEGATDTTEIIGTWKLVALRALAFPHPDTNWVLADPFLQQVLIGFSADRTFTFNDNYSFKNQLYDRYTTNDPTSYKYDSANFRLLATVTPTFDNGPIYRSPAVRQINPNTLLITYMGVDYTPQELYIRSNSSK